jgi:hypothetical protein
METTTQAPAEHIKELHSKPNQVIHYGFVLTGRMLFSCSRVPGCIKKYVQTHKNNPASLDRRDRLVSSGPSVGLLDKVVQQLENLSLDGLRIAKNHFSNNAAVYNDRFLGRQVQAKIRKACKEIWESASDADRLALAARDETQQDSLLAWIEDRRQIHGPPPPTVGCHTQSLDDTLQLIRDCATLGNAAYTPRSEGTGLALPEGYDTAETYDGMPSLESRLSANEVPHPSSGASLGGAYVYRQGQFFELRKPLGDGPYEISETPWTASNPTSAQFEHSMTT